MLWIHGEKIHFSNGRPADPIYSCLGRRANRKCSIINNVHRISTTALANKFYSLRWYRDALLPPSIPIVEELSDVFFSSLKILNNGVDKTTVGISHPATLCIFLMVAIYFIFSSRVSKARTPLTADV